MSRPEIPVILAEIAVRSTEDIAEEFPTDKISIGTYFNFQQVSQP
jgi:hypothetical protein